VSAEKVKENLFSFVEVTVLKSLSDAQSTEATTIEVSELASVTGIKDNDEVLRALYTLEGKSLARPHPEGDFTSNSWKITQTGIKALGLMSDGAGTETPR